MIYGAALFTVMKCHGLMKSPGKQIPGFERKKKKRTAPGRTKERKAHTPIHYFLFFLFTTLSTQNKVHIQREEYNGRDMSDGFSFQIFNMATFERQLLRKFQTGNNLLFVSTGGGVY